MFRWLGVPAALITVTVTMVTGTAGHAAAGGDRPALRGDAATTNNLPYRGGPVMHQPTIYPIFWLPDGYHFHAPNNANSDDTYEGLVTQFLTDLGGSDLSGLLTQYYDRHGHISGQLDIGDGIVDTTPFPDDRGSVSRPLLNSDIKAEILSDASDESWQNNQGETEFVVYTPYDLQVCTDPVPGRAQSCTYRPGIKNGRCGYHSYFTDQSQRYIFAVITDGASFCHAWQNRITDDTAPNGDVYADIAVDVTSHELFESFTDPYLNAWAATIDDEIGDKCSSFIGPIDDNGGDILLNGDEYIVQKEWSNVRHRCSLN